MTVRPVLSTFCALLAALAGLFAEPASAADEDGGKSSDTITCEHVDTTKRFGAVPVCISQAHYYEDLCNAIEALARRHDLPPGYFARLIWQESRFDPNALSPKGAQGIAQFIPSTAKLRGLNDSFNPADALAKSAAYLSEMTRIYGNLGLAAVGYNAGEARIGPLVDDARPVPAETQNYVLTITGLPVTAWADAKPKDDADYRLDKKKPFLQACLDLANTRSLPSLAPAPDWKPWGAEIGAASTPASARRIFTTVKDSFPKVLDGEDPLIVPGHNASFGNRKRYTVRIGRDSRSAALQVCRSITASGGFCIVRRN
ncbi:lytic transglycosylase domain-containing protein [Pararhizobium mangrovi]|nr:lytic transglycosylase domain-containing protein [Pararhizobium mangrovi]